MTGAQKVILEEARQLLTADKTADAITRLRDYGIEDQELLDILDITAGRLTRLKTQDNKGVLSFEEAHLLRNKINDALLTVINGLYAANPTANRIEYNQFADFAKPNTTKNKSDWESFFSTYPIKKKIELINTVDCDRDEHYRDKLSNHFKTQHKKEGNLVYFISACPTQNPVSIAKRLIYSYREEITFIISDDKHVKFIPLEVRSTPQKTWGYFWDKFQEYVLNERITFEKFIINSTKFFKKEKRLALTFVVEENSWGEADDIQNHIDLILKNIARIPLKNQKLVLFFVFHFFNIHEEISNQCEHWLSALNNTIQPGEKHTDDFLALSIDKLPQVEFEFIRRWATDKIDIRSFNELQDVLEMRSNTPKTEITKTQKKYDMQVVEEMQYTAYLNTQGKF